MNKDYSDLEKTIIRYKDLVRVPAKDNLDRFVSIDAKILPNSYQPKSNDMAKIMRDKIIVRERVLELLINAQRKLQSINENYSLLITYGYRSLDIQTKRFSQQLSNPIFPFFDNPTELYEAVHRFVAVPTVAGHPTGGAVDLLIFDIKTKKFLDFGSKQYNYSSKDCYVFSPYISKVAKQNRMLLRTIMLGVGFAPFDGEWWHFSYGDKEWAFYYKKNNAIYDQKKLLEVLY